MKSTVILSSKNTTSVRERLKKSIEGKPYLRRRFVFLKSIEKVYEFMNTNPGISPQLDDNNLLISSGQSTYNATIDTTREKDSPIWIGATDRLHVGDEITFKADMVVIKIINPDRLIKGKENIFMVISWP